MVHEFQKPNPQRDKLIYKLKGEGKTFFEIADIISAKYDRKISRQRALQLYNKYVKNLGK